MYMNIHGKVEGIFRDFVGFIGFVEFGMSTQLVVDSLVIVEGMLGGRLIIYIYCMVSTIYFFNFYSTSQLDVVLLFIGSQSLNNYFSITLFEVLT